LSVTQTQPVVVAAAVVVAVVAVVWIIFVRKKNMESKKSFSGFQFFLLNPSHLNLVHKSVKNKHHGSISPSFYKQILRL